jgi:hypothetical protein
LITGSDELPGWTESQPQLPKTEAAESTVLASQRRA